MSDIIKVKVVKMSRDSWWYDYLVGKTISVRRTSDSAVDYLFHSVTDGHSGCLILKDDCVVVATQQELQERLQQAKAAVEAIEKQLAEEAEKEAYRPFTREEYEKVVAEYRGCAGRLYIGIDNTQEGFCFSISHGRLSADVWITCTLLPFGVAFESQGDVENAIAKVGADNLKRAWAFELSIGL